MKRELSDVNPNKEPLKKKLSVINPELEIEFQNKVAPHAQKEFVGQLTYQNGFRPISNYITPLLTDMYQITMAYAYWKNKTHEINSVFELFFRENPFKGEYCIFAGLEEVLRFVASFKFTESEINFLREGMPLVEQEFFEYLKLMDCSKVTIRAIREGTIVFPKLPLIQVEGPIIVCQLLETTLLNLVNFPSLVCTNSARHRKAAGDKILLEFGLRRAQGVDGAMTASRYSYMGGFNGTSNVLAGKMFGIPFKGTHAHSFVTSFVDPSDLKNPFILTKSGKKENFWEIVLEWKEKLDFGDTNIGELIAFTAYAISYPDNFLALVDTYETLKSGVPNFLIVAFALHQLGYKADGIRLDSGDLAYLSRECRKLFKKYSQEYEIEYFAKFNIVASNDITEETVISLNQEGHSIDVFGIGTNLVTCKSQPALGCVYKLVEYRGVPRIKISQQITKVTIPSKKQVYRIYGNQDYPLLDLIQPFDSPAPKVGEKILVCAPFNEQKRCYVCPNKVVPLLETFFENGKVQKPLPSLLEIKSYCREQLTHMREDYVRFLNPTPYKVSVTPELYQQIRDMWLRESPILVLN